MIGAQVSIHGNIVLPLDAGLLDEFVQWRQGAFFRKAGNGGRPDSRNVRRIAASRGQHQLALDLAEAGEFVDEDAVLRAVVVVHHCLHRIVLEPRPLFPILENDSTVGGLFFDRSPATAKRKEAKPGQKGRQHGGQESPERTCVELFQRSQKSHPLILSSANEANAVDSQLPLSLSAANEETYRPQPLGVEDHVAALIAPVDSTLRVGQAKAYDLAGAGGRELREFVLLTVGPAVSLVDLMPRRP